MSIFRNIEMLDIPPTCIHDFLLFYFKGGISDFHHCQIWGKWLILVFLKPGRSPVRPQLQKLHTKSMKDDQDECYCLLKLCWICPKSTSLCYQNCHTVMFQRGQQSVIDLRLTQNSAKICKWFSFYFNFVFDFAYEWTNQTERKECECETSLFWFTCCALLHSAMKKLGIVT